MPSTERNAIEQAIRLANEAGAQPTGGKWLEDVTVASAPSIKEWDIAQCYRWSEWPERDAQFPRTTAQDIGIDCVAVRRSDGEHIAIQCKSRQLDANGYGAPISKDEVDSFASASSGSFWAERWIVTNGDNPLNRNAQRTLSMADRPVKMINILNDLLRQREAYVTEICPHCQPEAPTDAKQAKSCMQSEAVARSVKTLKEHAQSVTGGSPVGQARGKIILPCGTGKTRISLRIVEQLAPPGELAIVLCPSIALVAQLRREYLIHASTSLRALAVCSDETAGYDPKGEDKPRTYDNPTADRSNVSATEVKGKVTTDAQEIADWIRQGRDDHAPPPPPPPINVIFGTYQSSHRIAEALCRARTVAVALVADEAHRTAGLRRLAHLEDRIRDFTVCHDNDRFPAKYRIYQTATPRVYDTRRRSRSRSADWIVRNMDDESVFGVELYRKSYMEAVANGWLADYRIIALGVNDPDAYQAANKLAQTMTQKGRNALTATHFLKGLTLALALGGATNAPGTADSVGVKSCIAFMNAVAKSKAMAQQLQSETVRNWVQQWLNANHRNGRRVADYALEHLDASSNVTARERAKSRLASATEDKPYAVVNVGIFGEGTDAPSLSAVAFLEARKSPIDVIQAVGRAMRTAPGKERGYIICPILIPPNVDAEQWLKTSGPEDGWQELGQILLALRAHDSRIEDRLADLLQLYVPAEPETVTTVVAIANRANRRIGHYGHIGKPGQAQQAVENVLEGRQRPSAELIPLTQLEAWANDQDLPAKTPFPSTQNALPPALSATAPTANGQSPARAAAAPTTIMTGKKTGDGTPEIRIDSVSRAQPKADGTPGAVDYKKTRAKAKDMINNDAGVRLPRRRDRRPKRTPGEVNEGNAMQMLLLTGLEDHGNAIMANLLSKSGLSRNRVDRDLNVLEASVSEAAHHLRGDAATELDRHFQLDNLDPNSQNKQADGCTIAALLMMNAAMLHQRIAHGRWLAGVSDLETVKNDPNVVRRLRREWGDIMLHDFHPVLLPAVKAMEAAEDSGKVAGLERALRHIAAEAERIAETYADMGSDHAGPLFNRVMGNQASDGAYFTRPVAASIAARLTLDAAGDADWTDPRTWRSHKTVDLACGSGTLLAAMLTDMKRRARAQGASAQDLSRLQKVGVEDAFKGLDINPVSLQLAASQLTAGNQDIRYRRMGLHQMPYGPRKDDSIVRAGTLELLLQKSIVPDPNALPLPDAEIASRAVWNQRDDDAELEDAVEAASDARIVIMNPPFTHRAKMGEKFPAEVQTALRKRADAALTCLTDADPDMADFGDKTSIGPLFVALADRCVNADTGILTGIRPTTAMSATSGQRERQVLASRFHIHTVLTCHLPSQKNMSQDTSINESIIVARRHAGPKPPTRFIHLDKMPRNEIEIDDLHRCLLQCAGGGAIANGWGEVSQWPAERMEAGDWTPAVWRSPELALASAQFARHSDLYELQSESGQWRVHSTGRMLRGGSFEPTVAGTPGSLPILKSKGVAGQTSIQSTPDEHWRPQQWERSKKILEKAGYLLISAGQDTSGARVTATAGNEAYVGNGWMPVTGLSRAEAKAVAVFINSTAGRLQLMQNPGRKLEFPTYSAKEVGQIRVPDIDAPRIRQTLAHCWEKTKRMIVPQFRDGECEVRRLWDEAVARAMAWDSAELSRLRHLLHNEPHVRGLGYNQYADEETERQSD